ncbi:MarC family protein [Ahrensia sp. 13_GOM-1096m]|uniref:MarC family protein n=1 Tax=Ahrensia sp. 13_GOM-1096m TaxID=1380380 RepID=UPI00047DD05B|nr:MarC family protein [Ahrensia sp. 13_GOM-1096m]
MIDWSSILKDFITIFVVIDPIGSLPVFLYATAGVPSHLHRRFAIRAVFISAAVLMAFLIGGQFLLEALGLRLGAFQIAGGLILLLFALQMIFGDSKPSTEIKAAEKDHLSGAVFPLAMPSIASPGAMLGVVILTDNYRYSIPEQAVTATILLIVLGLTLLLLLLASKIHKIIGATGASVVSRVMGIVLATIAVDSILAGLEVVGAINLSN